MSKVQVKISQGIVEGKIVKTKDEIAYKAFLGIPYAKPPIGDLKFRNPVPAEGWSGVRDATHLGNTCAQMDIHTNYNYSGKEDCLYLNVYVPSTNSNEQHLPVMFWIHGGGFVSESGNPDIYGPDFLIQKDVILVTFNYRLGPLGFLCLNIPEIPGNMGLKDQVVALKWVNKNIINFGGNPKNITIFGESAGGASCHFMLLSKTAKGLFHKAIIQSGSSLNNWSVKYDPEGFSFKLGRLLGFEGDDDKQELHKFLLDVPVEKLYSVASSVEMYYYEDSLTTFSPVIEKHKAEDAFITDNPLQLIESGNFSKVPTIYGYTSNEGVFALLLKPEMLKMRENSDLQSSIDFQQYIPKYIFKSLSSEQKIEVANKIKNYYFSSNTFVWDKFYDLLSDFHFVNDINFSINSSAKFLKEIYYYRFSYTGNLNLLKYFTPFTYTGACHGDDLSYLFGINWTHVSKDKEVKPNENDILVRERMTEMWTNFAKYSNPTPEITDKIPTLWKPVTENKLYFLDITDDLQLGTDPFEDRIKFWKNLEKI